MELSSTSKYFWDIFPETFLVFLFWLTALGMKYSHSSASSNKPRPHWRVSLRAELGSRRRGLTVIQTLILTQCSSK